MTSILFSSSEMQSLVIGLELFSGTAGLILVYLLTKKQPKQANRNIILYIFMLSVIFYAIFYKTHLSSYLKTSGT